MADTPGLSRANLRLLDVNQTMLQEMPGLGLEALIKTEPAEVVSAEVPGLDPDLQDLLRTLSQDVEPGLPSLPDAPLSGLGPTATHFPLDSGIVMPGAMSTNRTMVNSGPWEPLTQTSLLSDAVSSVNSHQALDDLMSLMQRQSDVLQASQSQLPSSPQIYTPASTAYNTTTFSGHMTGSSGHMTGSSGHMTGSSGHMTGSSGHMTGSFGHMTGSSGHMTGSSGHMTGSSGHMTGSSGHMTGSSGHMTGSSGHMTAPQRTARLTEAHSESQRGERGGGGGGGRAAPSHPFQVDTDQLVSVPVSEQDQELQSLGLRVYNRDDIEQGIMAQVDQAIAQEEEQRFKTILQKQLKAVVDDIGYL